MFAFYPPYYASRWSIDPISFGRVVAAYASAGCVFVLFARFIFITTIV